MALNPYHRALLVLVVFTPSVVLAQSQQQQVASDVSGVEQRQTQIRDTLREQAKDWGLSEHEWERYESIMEGIRGIWSPGLDPLTALGVEAETTAERRRYAELMVEVERARVERELAFEREYQAAWARLYPDELRVLPFETNPSGGDGGAVATGNGFLSQLTGGSSAGGLSTRARVYVAREGCRECSAAVSELIGNGQPLDIFVVDAGGDDDAIRAWARAHEIPVEAVQTRRITLNHGALDASRGITPERLPVVQ